MGDGENKNLICTTHGHEQVGQVGNAGVMGVQRREKMGQL